MLKPLDFYKENLQHISFSGCPKEEQETIISYGRCDNTASVETTDPTVLTKLKKCALFGPDEWVLTNVTVSANESDPMVVTSVRFECPKRLVLLRQRSVTKKEMTEEERVAVAKRLSKNRIK